MVAQLRINKETCILHNCFHYFFHSLYNIGVQPFHGKGPHLILWAGFRAARAKNHLNWYTI